MEFNMVYVIEFLGHIISKHLRLKLHRAEGELVDRCWSPPSRLQQWLQLTREVENKAYIKKETSAEKLLQQAREAVLVLNSKVEAAASCNTFSSLNEYSDCNKTENRWITDFTGVLLNV